MPARSLGFVIGRRLGGGMHEDLDITNHGRKHVRFNLEIAIRSDFADVFEVKLGRIVRRGRITTEWSDAASEAAHDLSQPGLPARRAYRHATRRPPRPPTPMAGSASRWGSTPDRPGIAACIYDLIDGNRHFHGPQDCRMARMPRTMRTVTPTGSRRC